MLRTTDITSFSLTKMPKKADKMSYGTEAKRDRHEQLQRSLCGASANAAGKDRSDGRATRRKDGSVDSNAVQLGKFKPVADQRRSAPRLASSERERALALAERVVDAILGFILNQSGGKTDKFGMANKKKEPDKTIYSGRFAARLRKLREKAGITVEEMVAQTGIPKRTLYSYEEGERMPPYDTLPIIAKTIGVKVRTLLPED